jgi:hypothetical protein
MVRETWAATAALKRPAPPRSQAPQANQPRFLGHFIGFLQAKERANRKILERLQQMRKQANRPKGSSPPRFESALLSPSATEAVFDGPGEPGTDFVPPDPQIAAGPTDVVVVVHSLTAGLLSRPRKCDLKRRLGRLSGRIHHTRRLMARHSVEMDAESMLLRSATIQLVDLPHGAT